MPDKITYIAQQLPAWAQEMIDHYDRTGVYRMEDLERALQDDAIRVRINAKMFMSNAKGKVLL